MPDVLTPTQCHRCMSHIRSKATKPEILVRKWLWAHGYRYRLNVKSVPGKPDIVMRKYRTAIFVYGCFWHGHEGCKQFFAENQHDFLEGQDRKEPNQGYKELRRTDARRLASNSHWQCNLTKEKLESTMQTVAVT